MNPNSNQKRIAFGYNRYNGKIVLHENQAGAVQFIYGWYLEEKSIATIQELLQNCGFISPQNKPTWGKQSIANILSNPHYLGDETYPTIITQEDFDQVQALKHQRAPGSKQADD